MEEKKWLDWPRMWLTHRHLSNRPQSALRFVNAMLFYDTIFERRNLDTGVPFMFLTSTVTSQSWDDVCL